MLKILVKNIKQVKQNVDDKQAQMLEHMKVIKEDLRAEILTEVNKQFVEIKDLIAKESE